MFNFPDTPTSGQIYTPPGGASYRWTGSVWTTQGVGGSGVLAGNVSSTNMQAVVKKPAAKVAKPKGKK